MANLTIEELRKRHDQEIAQFVKDCPHTDVSVEDSSFGSERAITLRCNNCKLNLLGFLVSRSYSYLSYVRDCVNGYPDSRKHGVTTTNGKIIFDVLEQKGK